MLTKEKIVEMAKKYCYFIRNQQKEEIQPIAMIVNADDKIDLVSAMTFANNQEKDMFAAFLKKQVVHGARAIVVIIEAWQASFKSRKESDEMYKKYQQVCQMPDRIEVVLIAYHSLNDSCSYAAKIEDNVLGDEWQECKSIEGRFGDLFRQVQRDLAENN